MLQNLLNGSSRQTHKSNSTKGQTAKRELVFFRLEPIPCMQEAAEQPQMRGLYIYVAQI